MRGRILAVSIAITAAVLLPVSASAVPIPGDAFWSTETDGRVLHLDPAAGTSTAVGAFSGAEGFSGMDVAPATGLGFAIQTADNASTLYSSDVNTGAQTLIGALWRDGDVPADCSALDLTDGSLTAVCIDADDAFAATYGFIDVTTLEYTPLADLSGMFEALAMRGELAYAAFEDEIVTVPANGGAVTSLGRVTRADFVNPMIIAMDFDSAGQLWAIDTASGAGELLQIDLATMTAAVTPVAGLGAGTASLTFTWPAPATESAPSLPATGSSSPAVSIGLALALLALGAAVLVPRRSRAH